MIHQEYHSTSRFNRLNVSPRGQSFMLELCRVRISMETGTSVLHTSWYNLRGIDIWQVLEVSLSVPLSSFCNIKEKYNPKFLFCLQISLINSVTGLTTAKGGALALQANDPHAVDFTLAILRLHENGFLDSLRRKWWEIKDECPNEKETGKLEILHHCVVLLKALVSVICSQWVYQGRIPTVELETGVRRPCYVK